MFANIIARMTEESQTEGNGANRAGRYWVSVAKFCYYLVNYKFWAFSKGIIAYV
jgi:hypothetical protein